MKGVWIHNICVLCCV